MLDACKTSVSNQNICSGSLNTCHSHQNICTHLNPIKLMFWVLTNRQSTISNQNVCLQSKHMFWELKYVPLPSKHMYTSESHQTYVLGAYKPSNYHLCICSGCLQNVKSITSWCLKGKSSVFWMPAKRLTPIKTYVLGNLITCYSHQEICSGCLRQVALPSNICSGANKPPHYHQSIVTSCLQTVSLPSKHMF